MLNRGMDNIDFRKLFMYGGFFLTNILLWLLMMGLALSMITGCASSKPQAPTLEELKERFAEVDTLKEALPVAISIPADSAKITILPDLLPVDMPVLQESKKGGLQISAIRRKDNSLDISAFQMPLIIRDTIEREVPVVTFVECKTEDHISRAEAEKMTLQKVKEFSEASTKKSITHWLILILLIVIVIFLTRVFSR